MKTICAWCKKLIREDDGIGETSHGICPACVSKTLSEPAMPLKDLLNRIEIPLMLVDREGRPVSINESVNKMINKDDSEILHHLGGEVFNCIYHKTEHGCGKDIHCKACTIRTCVQETYMTGIPKIKVPATLKIMNLPTEQDVSFLISTEKSENNVLLYIEEVDGL